MCMRVCKTFLHIPEACHHTHVSLICSHCQRKRISLTAIGSKKQELVSVSWIAKLITSLRSEVSGELLVSSASILHSRLVAPLWRKRNCAVFFPPDVWKVANRRCFFYSTLDIRSLQITGVVIFEIICKKITKIIPNKNELEYIWKVT